MALSVDLNGWPTAQAVYAKIVSAVSAGDVSLDAFGDIGASLAGVIAEFQAPKPIGTGRNFSPATEMRSFDGNGYPELTVPDILPGNAITITIYSTPIIDFALKDNYRHEGASTLTRNLDIGTLFNADLPPQVWPVGHQNIRITATWGANVSADIADGIACETARRILTADQAGVTGAGQSVAFEKGQLSTGSGALNLKTSLLVVWGDRYRSLVESYSDKEAWKRRALVRRMS